MKLVVLLEKSDIVTRPLGKNIEIDAPGQVKVIFTREAAEEFARDVPETIRKWIDAEDKGRDTAGTSEEAGR